MVELWRELKEARFETESLGFLPRAPVLMKFGGESRVAALRLARDDRLGEEDDLVGQVRRSGAS
jgi:hypothetical protein